MDNKDEKTFADLFSSSTTAKEDNTQTFSNMSSSSNEETKEDSRAVTFDSIFDRISDSKEEPKETSSSLFEDSKLEDVKIEDKPEPKNNNEIFADNYINKDSTPKSDISAQTEGTILESKTDEESPQKETFNPFIVETIEDENIQVEKDEKKTSMEDNESQFNSPFFQTTHEESNQKELKDEKKESESIEKTTSELEKETIQFENLFFQPNEEISNQGELKIDKISEDTVDSTTNDLEEQPQKEKSNIEVNPFLNDDNNISQNEKEEDKIDSLITENPFLIEDAQLQSENAPQIEKTTNPEIEKEEPPKSISPFFQEDNKSEENHFFQNQINLIENQVPNTPSGNIDTAKSKHYNVKIVKKKEPLIKFILGVISYALFIWLLLIGITLLVYVLDIKIRAAKGDYSTPKFNAYVVLTGSMLPDIQVYDVVITKKVDAEKLNEGDVITFASNDSRFLGTIITHRIIKKNPATDTEGYTFQTKGDNNNVADNALVPEKNIYGKVILKIPKLGYLQEFLASDGGWIIVILIPCLTVISYDIVKLTKGLKRKKYKNIKVQK